MLMDRSDDAARATGQIPKGDKAEKAGERTGLETGFEDAVCFLFHISIYYPSIHPSLRLIDIPDLFLLN